MAKHNPKEPKFRCNFCKEYHNVPEYKTMYQCASHGYVCEKVVVTNGSLINLKFGSNIDFEERKVKFPLKYFGFCNLDGTSYFTKIRTEIHSYDYYLKQNGLSVDSTDQDVIDIWWNEKFNPPKRNQPATYGCKKTIKYNWSDELNLWIEEGNENFLKDKKPTKHINITKNNTEIKLLLDLFEKNILSKEQFVSQLKEKL